MHALYYIYYSIGSKTLYPMEPMRILWNPP